MTHTKERFYVVFDGTSHFIESAEVVQEMDLTEMEVINSYYSMDYAEKICNKLNEKCIEHLISPLKGLQNLK